MASHRVQAGGDELCLQSGLSRIVSEGDWPGFAISKSSGVQPVLNDEDIASARRCILCVLSLSLSLGSRVDNGKPAVMVVVPCLR